MPIRSIALLVLLIAVLSYGMGISGPLIFDDGPNLAQINRWLDGRSTWIEAIFGTGSGLLHRPVAHFSFFLDALIANLRPGHMKLMNLLFHLLVGLVIGKVVFRLVLRDPQLAPKAAWVALAVASIWLVHPINASTVLYVVQRMAQLSALFSLLAVWSFVSARESFELGKTATARLMLWLWLPGLIGLAALSKENGVLVPLYLLAIEVALFSTKQRPKEIKVFFLIALVVPAAVGLFALVLVPEFAIAGYQQRDFTLAERFLTQGRVLVDYLGQLIIPNPLRMGIYGDDFAVSTGLLSPVSTVFSWALLVIIAAWAIFARKERPLVFVGVAIFFAGHALESSILPLEVYFEHRNYLPGVGIVLAIVASLGYATSSHPGTARLALPLGCLVVLVLAVMTMQRSWVWADFKRITEHGLRYHPQSLRAHLGQATVLLQTGQFAASREVMAHLSTTEKSRNRAIGFLGIATVECIDQRRTDPQHLIHAQANLTAPATLSEVQAFDMMLRASNDKQCEGASVRHVLTLMDSLLRLANEQPDTDGPKWRLRLLGASYFAEIGEIQTALAWARLAWQPTADPAAASTLAQLQMRTRDFDGAEVTVMELESRFRRDSLALAEVSRLRDLLRSLNRKGD